MSRQTFNRLGQVLIALVCITLLGCAGVSSGGSSQNGGSNGGNPPTQGNGIPANFWAMIVNHSQNFPVQVPYGQYRIWDNFGAQWIAVEKCQASSGDPNDPCFDWSSFDSLLSTLRAAGVNDVLMTTSRPPLWAVDLNADPTGSRGTQCNYYVAGSQDTLEGPGQCLLPSDLNADGSGTDQIWKNWITAVVTRVNSASYLQSHSHIKYWEPWNEFVRSSVLNNYSGMQSFEGTYAQMVRLTEDMRCIITGKGIIHNFPAAGQSTPCNATAIDPNALITTPSSVTYMGGLDNMQNFLYCNGTGIHSPTPGSQCTTGNAGSQAVDIINFHFYATNTTPEQIASGQVQQARSMLAAPEQAKPLINGEGSWSDPTQKGAIWRDPYAQAGFIPRYFATYWSAGLTMNVWYSYDDNVGQLYDPNSGKLLEPQATAWKITAQWLIGGIPANSPFCANSGTIYTCDFTEANGTVAELVWDGQYGQNCSQMSQPIICGATNYSVPTKYNKDWVDLNGTSHGISSTVTIGANPILLEGQ